MIGTDIREKSMIKQFIEQKEKKVEYAELVYDLIFVYIIGRNNALLHHTVGGYVTFDAFLMYLTCTLAVIQIWNYTTYYINGYGRNSVRDHVFLFSNMFLMYFLARGTDTEWQHYHTMYHIAWALILLNIGAQYLIERRRYADDPVNRRRTSRMALILICEAVIVALAMVEFHFLGTTYASLLAILLGMGSVFFLGKKKQTLCVDFEHLSERVMLYVVFTFGEMIIAIGGYFDGELNPRNLYFALMGFLIVVGLFLSYGVVYDRIIDREMKTNGLSYMFIHIFLIFALNNITASLEFMQDEEIDLIQKMAFMVISLLVFFASLFATGGYSKLKCRLTKGFVMTLVGISLVFAALMFLLREFPMVHIALTVIYVFAIFLIVRLNVRRSEQA